jgi:cytochrome b involved in lipid metabolism
MVSLKRYNILIYMTQEIKIGVGLTILFSLMVFLSVYSGSPTLPSQTFTTKPASQTAESYTATEVAKHSIQNDCWIVVSGKVYNVTNYVFVHPGGADQIVPYCGGDATAVFGSIGKHGSSRAQADLAGLLIGSM